MNDEQKGAENAVRGPRDQPAGRSSLIIHHSSFPPLPDLTCLLTDLVGQIPVGRVTTYGHLADALGDRIAARWVGHDLLHHDHDATCGCHRVVRAGGELGGYVGGDPGQKAERLAAEGVEVVAGRVDLARRLFCDFATDRPLAALERHQRSVIERVELTPPADAPQTVAGIDVSYVSPNLGVAAYALVDACDGRLLWSATHAQPVTFPYISSYLAYRELPVVLPLLAQVRKAGRMADVLMVDGSGILHPRRAGVATQLGVVAGRPTIGVAKKLLCGSVDRDELQPGRQAAVTDQGEVIGTALLPRGATRRPLYISPGHLVDVEFAAHLAERLILNHRLPEPIYWADRLSRKGTMNDE